MRGPYGALVFSLIALPAAAAEVNVRVAEGRVDVAANAAPVAEVLDRLSKQTGMKVIYDGPVPRQVISVSLSRRTPAEAVVGVLEGLGLNYVLVGDPAGTGVQTLMMAGAASVATSRPAGPAPAPARPFSMPVRTPDDEPFDEPAEEEVEQPVPFGQPPSPPFPGPLPGVTPNPAFPTAPGVTPPQATPGATGPGFPGGAPPSYPVSPFTPTPFGAKPVFPGPVQPGSEPPQPAPDDETKPDS